VEDGATEGDVVVVAEMTADVGAPPGDDPHAATRSNKARETGWRRPMPQRVCAARTKR
jgi:hypothetical protein